MFDSLRELVNRKREVEQRREELMKAVHDATTRGCCVILSQTKNGTRIIVLGKPTPQRQIENILEKQDF